MKKRILSLLLALILFVFPLPISAEENVVFEKTYQDVPKEHVAYEAIMTLTERGVVDGNGEGLFFPDNTLKREEFVKILTEALALTKGSGAPVFYDVPAGTWYADYVITAASSGLINGVAENQFGVGSEVTRQDVAVIIKRYLEKQGLKKIDLTTVYADMDEVSDYAKEAVEFVASLNVMGPRENNLWCPKSPATRAEAAMAICAIENAEHTYVMSIGKDAGAKYFDPPYDVITDDRIAEMTPTPFDASNLDTIELHYEDFEDDDHGIFKKSGSKGATLLKEGGYNSNGCVRVVDEGYYIMSWTAKPGELLAGDYLVATAMVKGEGISYTGSGRFSPIVAIYDDNGTWLTEVRLAIKRADTDWVQVQNIIQIPEGVNELRTPEFYTIRLSANNHTGLTGTTWTDDIHFYKAVFHPMDTVLMEPVYKGIVKGDNGIGDIKARAYISDENGAYDLSKMNLTTQITDEDRNVYLSNTVETVTPVVDVCFSSKTLPMNSDLWLESILTDKETGEEIHRQEWGIHKREADFTTVMDIDEYGRLTQNGKPQLMTSIYTAKNYTRDEEYIFKNPAWDNWLNNGQGWYYNYGTSKSYRGYIDALEPNNTTVTLTFGATEWSSNTTGEIKNRTTNQAEVRALITRIMEAWKDSPVLSSYKVWDEKNGMRYGAEYEWTRKIIESVDLDHPCFGAIDNPIANRPGIYAKMADIMGYDPYPITGKDNQNIKTVYDRLMLGAKLNPNQPRLVYLQGFYYKKRGDLRAPTEEEYRNMAFQSICAGVVWIDSYAFFDIMENPTPGKTSDEMWAEYSGVMEEICYLEPMLLSVEPAPYYEVKNSDWLVTTARRHEGKSYLVCVNTDKNQQSAGIYLDGVKEIKGMYSKKVYQANESGWFDISFDEYETEVFEWESPDYLSSHAELKHFGLVGMHMLDAESEVATFCVPEGVTEADFAMEVSDFTSLYINGEKVEKTGTVKLDSVDELKVKVVSQDGRFTTEKTYKLQRD